MGGVEGGLFFDLAIVEAGSSGSFDQGRALEDLLAGCGVGDFLHLVKSQTADERWKGNICIGDTIRVPPRLAV